MITLPSPVIVRGPWRTLDAAPRFHPHPTVRAHRERYAHLAVIDKTPSWLNRRIRRALRGHRLGRNEFDFWQRFRECHWYDHSGSDTEGNFVAEPYAAHCAICRKMVDDFCKALGLDYRIGKPVWYGPAANLIRITILKPAEASE